MQAVSLKQVNSILGFGILSCIVLYYAREVLIPVTFSILLAMLMTPVANKLEDKGVKRAWSTLLCVLIVLIILLGAASLIVAQAVSFSKELPKAQEKGEKLLVQVQSYVESTFNIPPEKQIAMAKEQGKSFMQGGGKFFKSFLSGITGTLGSFVIVLVFMFLFLFQREKYEAFFLKLYKGKSPDEARGMFRKISKVAQHYLAGRALSVLILTGLYSIGLIIIGVKNAFLLAVVAAIATIIPYVGTIIGGLFPFFVALVTEDSFTPALMVLVVILLIQTIDNYFIEPYIVGGEVNVSAFFSIFILIVGGLIWGVAGILLFLPLLGITKIVFDHVPSLQPLGYLIGDQKESGSSNKLAKWIKEKLKKKE